jgi:hypothetical protein
MIARIAKDADLVLSLHHDDGVVAAIDVANVLHEGGEGASVGVAGGV